MGTVNKTFADKLISSKGYYGEPETWDNPDNPRCVLITEYDNAFGGVSYGLTFKGEQNRYTASNYVCNPRVYWEAREDHTDD